ncbi:MAG: S8 family serine peptidase [Rhodothermales bacterium]|nr:S8 family serine peptidase [Rhodothermales bacterium]MBO6779436.1 S8 family serine peptidase [Rhodothermales bacterium]
MYRRFFLFLGFAVLAGGCSESFTGSAVEERPETPREVQELDPDKFRHAHLLEKARGETAGKDGEELNLIFAINAQELVERYGIVERFRVVERYRLLERFEILERFEYEEVFDGYAVTARLKNGQSDFIELLRTMADDPEISWFEPDFGMKFPVSSGSSTATSQHLPWSVAMVGGATSSTQSGNGSGSVPVDVFVLDTGVAKANSSDPDDDLALVESIDFRPGMDDPADYDGHGTHIAGIIGAIDDSDGLVGIAPGSRIHNLKVLNDEGTTDVSVVVAAVEEIAKRKAAQPNTPMVVNMSLGEVVGTTEDTALDIAIDRAAKLGVIFVVAAGNQGVDASKVTPAKAKSAITVGSHDMLGAFSWFSNHGKVIDILAPGDEVVSLSPIAHQTATLTGTSMSAAHVTGAVALYLHDHPQASSKEVLRWLHSKSGRIHVGVPKGTLNNSLWVGEGPAPGAQTIAGTDLGTRAAQTHTISVRISDKNDDAEERVSNGDMYRSSSDLELSFDGSKDQIVGIRFRGLDIPKGATITEAYVQFTVDEKNSGDNHLRLAGENTDDASSYGSSDYDISNRAQTASHVTWSFPAWTSVGAAGMDQRTPNIAAVVQEIVNRSGWNAGNDMAFMISGKGERTAESYNGSSSKAPLLVVTYSN